MDTDLDQRKGFSKAMNILFITLVTIDSLSQKGIYADLVRELSNQGHKVSVVSPIERRENKAGSLVVEGTVKFLRVKTLNNQKVSKVEKALALLTTPFLIRVGIKKYFRRKKFDLIMYSTPPLTLCSTVAHLKKFYGAKTYLLLKDIWPQAAIDMDMFGKHSIFSCYFKHLEKRYYNLSDKIGCMSQGNIDFVHRHNPKINLDKLEICPNSLEPMEVSESNASRQKFNIPDDAVVFVYGGNFGKPQGFDFILACLEKFLNHPKVYFVLVGSGTEYKTISNWVLKHKPRNILLKSHLPKPDYFELLMCSDVGMVFLSKDFTVPNIPSRTLDYLQFSLPILGAVDPCTDFRKIVNDAGFGLCSVSGDMDAFCKNIERFLDTDYRKTMGEVGRKYLENNWTAKISANKILNLRLGDYD